MGAAGPGCDHWYQKSEENVRMRPLIIFVGVLSIGACCVIGGIAVLRPYVLADQCSSNLKQIGCALCNYHDYWKCFPPASYTDQTGDTIHSWRMLALAFLEQNTIYDAYRFDESWNSANNITLGRKRYQVPLWGVR
jgi:hypothetical protein